MAARPTLVMRVILIFLTVLAIVWQCLMIFACVPRAGGGASALSNFHLMELSNSTRTVRFGYMAFCTSVQDSDSAPVIQFCNGIDSITNPSSEAVSSKLPNLDRFLFDIAFSLNRTAFPALPVVTLIGLFAIAGLLITHCVVNSKNRAAITVINLNIYLLLGCATILSLVSATNFTITFSTFASQLQVTDSKFKASRGQGAFALHWIAFAQITFITLMSVITLRLAQPKSRSRSARLPKPRTPPTNASATRTIETFDAESVYSTDIDSKYVPTMEYEAEKDPRMSSVMAYYHYNPNCFNDINQGRFDPDSYSIYTVNHGNGLHRSNSTYTNTLQRPNSTFTTRALTRANSTMASNNAIKEVPEDEHVVERNSMALVPSNTASTNIGTNTVSDKALPPRSDVHEIDAKFTAPLAAEDVQTRYIMMPYNAQPRLQRNPSNGPRLSSKYSRSAPRSANSNQRRHTKYNFDTIAEDTATNSDADNMNNSKTTTGATPTGVANGEPEHKLRYYSGVAYDVDLRHSMAGR